MELSKTDFENFRAFNGMCVVEIPALSSTTVPFNGSTLEVILTKEEERAKQARRQGILIKTPANIPWVSGDMWRCDLEAEIGDDVWFEGFYATEQIERRKLGAGQDKVLEVEGKTYIQVPARTIVAAKREDKYIPCNGYVLGEILPEETVTASGLTIIGSPTEYNRIRVVATPEKLPEFRNPDLFKNVKVETGQIVWVNKKYPVWLDKTYSATSDLVRFQSFCIAAFE